MNNNEQALFSIIKQGAALPEQVFQEGWGRFLVFDSDRMFACSFANCFEELSKVGQSPFATMVNLDTLKNTGDWSAAVKSLAQNIGEQKYLELLNEGGPGTNWMCRVECFALIPNNLLWVIYTDRISEIAIVGFPESTFDQNIYDLFIQRLDARDIKRAFEDPPISYVFSQQGFLPAFRGSLIAHYS